MHSRACSHRYARTQIFCGVVLPWMIPSVYLLLCKHPGALKMLRHIQNAHKSKDPRNACQWRTSKQFAVGCIETCVWMYWLLFGMELCSFYMSCFLILRGAQMFEWAHWIHNIHTRWMCVCVSYTKRERVHLKCVCSCYVCAGMLCTMKQGITTRFASHSRYIHSLYAFCKHYLVGAVSAWYDSPFSPHLSYATTAAKTTFVVLWGFSFIILRFVRMIRCERKYYFLIHSVFTCYVIQIDWKSQHSPK